MAPNLPNSGGLPPQVANLNVETAVMVERPVIAELITYLSTFPKPQKGHEWRITGTGAEYVRPMFGAPWVVTRYRFVPLGDQTRVDIEAHRQLHRNRWLRAFQMGSAVKRVREEFLSYLSEARHHRENQVRRDRMDAARVVEHLMSNLGIEE